MRAGFVTLAAALLLGTAETVPASAQERGVGVTRGSTGRVGSGWSRPGQQGTGRERVRSSNPRDRSDPTPRDRWGSVGRVDQRPITGQPVYGVAADHRSRYHRKSYHSHAHHHGACFGHHGLHVGAHFGTAFVILVDAVAYPTYTYAAPYSVYYNPSGGTTLLQGGAWCGAGRAVSGGAAGWNCPPELAPGRQGGGGSGIVSGRRPAKGNRSADAPGGSVLCTFPGCAWGGLRRHHDCLRGWPEYDHASPLQTALVNRTATRR